MTDTLQIVPRDTTGGQPLASEAPAVPITGETLGNTGSVRGPGASLSLASPAVVDPGFLATVQNIPEHLERRRPVAQARDELQLFNRVPNTHPDYLRDEVELLLAACNLTSSYVNSGLSVAKAVVKALSKFSALGCAVNTFRGKYENWVKSGDWLVLLNKAKAGWAWQDIEDIGLPDAFIAEIAQHFASHRRADTKATAIRRIRRWWQTGKDFKDKPRPIPGYEQVRTTSTSSPSSVPWSQRNPELLPPGWSPSNILRQIDKRRAFTATDRMLTHEGTAAAKPELPQVHGTAANLRFMEEVTFDDLKTDIIVFDPETGKDCELWLLVARCKATRIVLGFVQHLSLSREDGSTSHLGHKEMKQLAAWLLERYHLPPYRCIWRVERGTATLSEGSARAISEMLPGRIEVRYTSMINGKSPVGYKEKAKGNSMGKASHESHNRIFHMQASHLPGQTGAHYGIRPADLPARIKECIDTWELRNRLPAHLRGQEKYSLLLPEQAREHFIQFCLAQNFRTDHTLEGFERLAEWYDCEEGKWKPQNTYVPGKSKTDRAIRTRRESPVERAVKLIEPYRDQWERVSPDIIIAFLSFTQKVITKDQINTAGEIRFVHEGQSLTFRPPTNLQLSLCDLRRGLLGYYSPNDLAYLHATDARGGIVGTWYRAGRVPSQDEAALSTALRYTTNALKAAQAHAAALAAPEREHLESIRAHNTELAERGNAFNVTSGAEVTSLSNPDPQPSTLNSSVATVLTTVAEKTRKQIKAEKKATAELEDKSLDAFRKAASQF
jgi:hypothetical protein